MDIRNILVSLDPLASPAPTLGLAISLAEKLGSKVSASAAARPWFEPIGAEMGPAAVTLYDEQRKQIDAALANLESSFLGSVPPDMRGRFHALIDEPTQHLIDRAMAADLILVGSTSIGTDRPQIRVDAGRVILAAGRPVLIAAEGSTAMDSSPVLVAWKDTREARRAVADALPLLQLAKQVLVVSVNEDDYAAERESLSDLLTWLQWHGISARSDVLPLKGSVVETLEVAALSVGADMVVAGGYGHARLQEWLFGGATYDLLRLPKLHRLLSN